MGFRTSDDAIERHLEQPHLVVRPLDRRIEAADALDQPGEMGLVLERNHQYVVGGLECADAEVGIGAAALAQARVLRPGLRITYLNGHGAASVTQFEVMPEPPVEENRPLTWPYWPLKLRTSSSHDEGCEREFAISTKEFLGADGKVTGLKTVRVEWKDGKMAEVPGSEQVLPADLVLLAMGFVSPVATMLDAFGIERDARGNARAGTDLVGGYVTNVPKVFAAGDIRRGQSLVVWAIREGRQAARAVDEFLMGFSELPR